MSYMPDLTPNATRVGERVAYEWRCESPGYQDARSHGSELHSIDCLWVWHDCAQILSPTSVAPGEEFGWRPTGVGAHTLVQADPLTLTASVYWPDCCGLHGFITNGEWTDA